ncbi:probable disease resistance RPP8-like protein 2 [Salvia hispanica]|uniref:probable disease resistance RPP8-like protein 2 n=1 Tax=Salvia hispanica TaxID=49212 RepID=UPI002009B33C|nr:probable disease resistance RPP8-like protein 2 [Salvia hispanica]
MAEAVILSLIQNLEKYQDDGQDESEEMETVIEDMREIVDIVRDKKYGEGRRLRFLVSDLVYMAQYALDFNNTGRSDKIEYIQSWVVEIKMRLLKLGVDGPETESNSENDDEDHVVVGLEKVIEMVLRTLILHTSQFPSMVVIKGMSGIGKMTLAREIYNHADVIARFKYRAWICVSNVLTLKEIFIKLLLHLHGVDGASLYTSSSLEEMDNQSLLDMLPQHLQGLPYLIVLDDLPKQIFLESLLWAIYSQGSTLELLEPYYQKLDPRLLPCFMFLALFKENTTLRENKLSQIWEAAGGLYDSDSYIYGLLDESVIDKVNDKSTWYRMNPVLHRLSIKKAEEGIDFEILGSTQLNRNPSHRVIICSRDNFSYPTKQDKYLISLFFHGGGYFNASPSYWKGFEKLEILDLEDFGLKNLPEAIGTLMELRYLGLRNNYIKELPKSVGRLKKLEVLDITQNFMVQVPDIIWEMGSLRHVYMCDVISNKPLKIHALRGLKTLTSVSFNYLICNELLMWNMLTSLEKLGVHDLDGNTRVRNLFWLLPGLKKFRHLILRGHRFRSMPCLDGFGIVKDLETLKLDGHLDRLPNSFPSKLTYLTLANSCLNEDPMPLLGKLPHLDPIPIA